MYPCAKSNAFNYSNSEVLSGGSEEDLCCIAIHQKAKSGRITCHICWLISVSVSLFLLLGGGERPRQRERERNLLKAPQTKQPFNKMHLIFLVFALVK